MQYLDAPVTGLPEVALTGDLTLFLGGSKNVIDEAQDYLLPVSSKQIHFGDIGAGTAYKLIVNLLGSIQIAATAESLLQAERAGLDLDKVAEALGTGGAGSPQVANNSKRMVAGKHDEDVVFSSNWRPQGYEIRSGIRHEPRASQPIRARSPTDVPAACRCRFRKFFRK